MSEIRDRPDDGGLAREAAEAVGSALARGVGASGRAALAVAGGRSVGPVFDVLADTGADWAAVAVTLVDERWVEADHPDSNEGLVRRRLLRGRAASARFEPLKRGAATLEADAAAASAALEATLPLDAVLLGLGDDGHVASLFPGSPALGRGLDLHGRDSVIAVPAGDGRPPPQPRLSLTLPVLAGARTIVLLAPGPTKRAALDRALAGEDLPVSHLLKARPDVLIFRSP